jgi:hypothetical protein
VLPAGDLPGGAGLQARQCICRHVAGHEEPSGCSCEWQKAAAGPALGAREANREEEGQSREEAEGQGARFVLQIGCQLFSQSCKCSKLRRSSVDTGCFLLCEQRSSASSTARCASLYSRWRGSPPLRWFALGRASSVAKPSITAWCVITVLDGTPNL